MLCSKNWIILFVVTLRLLQGTACATPEADAAREKAQNLLANMAVVGASQSSGFMSGVLLNDVLDSAIQFEHSNASYSEILFYKRPLYHGRKQIEKVLETDATSLIALDYLFWYVYGFQSSKSRLSRLQKGLDNLDKFTGIIYLGNIPNMEGASELFLPKGSVPPLEHLNAVNEVIRKWVKKRERVKLLPLDSWVNSMRNNKDIKLDGKIIHLKMAELMSWDRLHSNVKGQGLIAALCLDIIHSSLPALSSDDLIKDPDALHKIALVLIQKALSGGS